METIDIHYTEDIAGRVVEPLKEALTAYGVLANVTHSKASPMATGGKIYLKRLRVSKKIRDGNKGSHTALGVHSRLQAALYRLMRYPWKGEMLFPIAQCEAKVVCCGKQHRVYTDKRGNLVIPEHPFDEHEMDRAMSVLADDNTPRCLRLLDAWRRGKLDDEDGHVTLPKSLRPAYKRMKQLLGLRRHVAEAGKVEEAPDIEERWADTAWNAVQQTMQYTHYRHTITGQPGHPVTPANYGRHAGSLLFRTQQGNAYFDFQIATPYRFYPKCGIEVHQVLDSMEGNATARLNVAEANSWAGKMSKHYTMTLVFKRLALWYASVYKRGFANVNGTFVLEVLERRSIREAVVNAVRVGEENNKLALKVAPAVVKMVGLEQWALEWL